MYPLKILLWLTGIACLLVAPAVFVPMSSWEPATTFFGVESLPESPIFEYIARQLCTIFAGIGIYFIILGLHPLKYGVLVPFTGIFSILLGSVLIMVGIKVAMPPKWFLSDGISTLILGVLILLFWLRAKKIVGRTV